MGSHFNGNGLDQVNRMAHHDYSCNMNNQLITNDYNRYVPYYNLRSTPARRNMSEDRGAPTPRPRQERSSTRGRHQKKCPSNNVEVIASELNASLGYNNQLLQNYNQQVQEIAENIDQSVWNTMGPAEIAPLTQQMNSNIHETHSELDINFNNTNSFIGSSKQQLSSWDSPAPQKQMQESQYQPNISITNNSTYIPNQVPWEADVSQTNQPMPQEQPTTYEILQTFMSQPPPNMPPDANRHSNTQPVLQSQQNNDFHFKMPLLPTPKARSLHQIPAGNPNFHNYNSNTHHHRCSFNQPPTHWNMQNNYSQFRNNSLEQRNIGCYQQPYNQNVQYQNAGNFEQMLTQQPWDDIDYQYMQQNPPPQNVMRQWTSASPWEEYPQEHSRQQNISRTQQYSVPTNQYNPSSYQLPQVNLQIQQTQVTNYQTQMLGHPPQPFLPPVQQINTSIQQQTPSVQQSNTASSQLNHLLQTPQPQQMSPSTRQLSLLGRRPFYREGTPAVPGPQRRVHSGTQREATPMPTGSRLVSERPRERVLKREATPFPFTQPVQTNRTIAAVYKGEGKQNLDSESYRRVRSSGKLEPPMNSSISRSINEETQIASPTSRDKKIFEKIQEQLRELMNQKKTTANIFSKVPCADSDCNQHLVCTEAEVLVRHLRKCSSFTCKICDEGRKITVHAARCLDRTCDASYCRRLKKAAAAEREQQEMKELEMVELEQQINTGDLINSPAPNRFTEEDIADYMKYLN